MREVDAIEEHRQLRGVELRAEGLVVKRGELKAPLLEALVENDEAARVEAENLDAVTALRDEDEEVADEDVFLPLVAHDGAEAVDAVAHVDGLRGQQNTDRPREQQHGQPKAAMSCAR